LPQIKGSLRASATLCPLGCPHDDIVCAGKGKWRDTANTGDSLSTRFTKPTAGWACARRVVADSNNRCIERGIACYFYLRPQRAKAAITDGMSTGRARKSATKPRTSSGSTMVTVIMAETVIGAPPSGCCSSTDLLLSSIQAPCVGSAGPRSLRRLGPALTTCRYCGTQAQRACLLAPEQIGCLPCSGCLLILHLTQRKQ
jgi:hypothetical protein